MEEDLNAFGVTSDDHGILFVCDEGNKCIQMFSVSDGQYLGSLIKKVDQDFGVPLLARCCKDMSSLIVYDHSGWISKVELMY